MNIEEVKIADIHRIQKIAQETWPATFNKILSKEQIDYMLKWMYDFEQLEKQIKNGHLFYILSKNQEDCGFIGIELNYHSRGILKIHKLYIRPVYQGIGIGKKLVQKAKEIACQNEIKRISLNVNRFNDSLDFYRKMGFDCIKEEDIDIGNGYLMEDFVLEMVLD